MLKYLVLILILVTNATAQKDAFDRATFYSYGVKMFAEAHTLPDETGDSINVLVMFRAMYDALLFVQANPLDNPGGFQATPYFEVFFKDENGVIKNRILWTDTVWAKSYEDTKSKEIFSEGFVISKLPVADYNCTVQLLDRYRKSADKTELKLRSNLNFHTQNVISDPIYSYSTNDLAEYKSIPFILSNKINFTSKDAKILVPVSYDKNFNVFNFSITKDVKMGSSFWNDTVNFSGRVTPFDFSSLNVNKDKKYQVVMSIQTGLESSEKQDSKIVGILSIKLPSQNLSPGNYTLSIYNDNGKDSAKFDFEVIWIDMPLSLRNPSYSVEMMYYILNDEEFNKMNSGNDEVKAKKIMDYWKSKDPTRTTPFNEAMTEYFRRVDFAFFNYQTVRDKDGSKTDRGKIYILYGKPDKTEKVLSAGKQYEVWEYNKQSKKFHFELVSNGLFVLTKIDDNK